MTNSTPQKQRRWIGDTHVDTGTHTWLLDVGAVARTQERRVTVQWMHQGSKAGVAPGLARQSRCQLTLS